MNDGLQPDRSVTGPPALEVLTDRGDVERPGAQGTRERSTPFGEIEALQIGMQPSTPTRSGTLLVDDGER
jgi:hypothetical protein